MDDFAQQVRWLADAVDRQTKAMDRLADVVEELVDMVRPTEEVRQTDEPLVVRFPETKKEGVK